jgi:glutathione S-transferase
MPYRIEVEGLEPIIYKMRNFPKKLKDVMFRTLAASIIALQEAIEPYPPEPPNSTYTRTEILGKSLGSGFQGGRLGEVDGEHGIAKVEQRSGYQVATFGTTLEYAPYVIGDNTQAKIHRGRWWTIGKLAKKAFPRIQRLFDNMAKGLADWLDRNGYS